MAVEDLPESNYGPLALTSAPRRGLHSNRLSGRPQSVVQPMVIVLLWLEIRAVRRATACRWSLRQCSPAMRQNQQRRSGLLMQCGIMPARRRSLQFRKQSTLLSTIHSGMNLYFARKLKIENSDRRRIYEGNSTGYWRPYNSSVACVLGEFKKERKVTHLVSNEVFPKFIYQNCDRR